MNGATLEHCCSMYDGLADQEMCVSASEVSWELWESREALRLPLSVWKGQPTSERLGPDDVDRVRWDAECEEWAEKRREQW